MGGAAARKTDNKTPPTSSLHHQQKHTNHHHDQRPLPTTTYHRPHPEPLDVTVTAEGGLRLGLGLLGPKPKAYHHPSHSRENVPLLLEFRHDPVDSLVRVRGRVLRAEHDHLGRGRDGPCVRRGRGTGETGGGSFLCRSRLGPKTEATHEQNKKIPRNFAAANSTNVCSSQAAQRWTRFP